MINLWRERRLRAALVLVAAAVALMPLRSSQPKPDSLEYVEGAHQIAFEHRYVTTRSGVAQPPRYPFGFSLMAAPVTRLTGSGRVGVAVVAKTMTFLALALMMSIAMRRGGPRAAWLVLALTVATPLFWESAWYLMSDLPSATLFLGALALLDRPDLSGRRTLAVGLLAGWNVLVRIAAGVLLVPLLVFAWQRRTAARVLAGAALPIAWLAWWQANTFGRPWSTGYSTFRERKFAASNITKRALLGDGDDLFHDLFGERLLRWACPCPGGPSRNIVSPLYYLLALFGIAWVVVVPGVMVLAVWWCWKNRNDALARLFASLCVVQVAFLSLYFYRGARFLAPVAVVANVVAALGLVQLVENRRVRRRVEPVAIPSSIAGTR